MAVVAVPSNQKARENDEVSPFWTIIITPMNYCCNPVLHFERAPWAETIRVRWTSLLLKEKGNSAIEGT